jgi:hypothetical protein
MFLILISGFISVIYPSFSPSSLHKSSSDASLKSNRFHPYSTSTNSGPTSSTPLHSNSTSTTSFPILDYLGFHLDTTYNILICLSCGKAILPDAVLGHAKATHNIAITRADHHVFNKLTTQIHFSTNTHLIPPVNHQPVPYLKLTPSDYCCNLCSYCCLTKRTFAEHWNSHHQSLSSSILPKDHSHSGIVQTFYHPIAVSYFEVYPPSPPPSSTSLFDLFLRDVMPSYPPFSFNIPENSREIPPLLTQTQWHTHLKPYLSTKQSRLHLYQLAHSANITKTNLWKLTWNYSNTVSQFASTTSMRIRCLLMEYPRYVSYLINLFCSFIQLVFLSQSVSQKVKPWKYHTNPQTLLKYAYPLHSLVFAVLESLSNHPSQYKFPLSPLMEQKALTLISILKDVPIADHLPIFHDCIYSLLSYQPSISESSKWSIVIECWLAIYAFHPEGHFSSPKDITGILAKMEYHCRGSILYESHLQSSSFPNNSLLKYVLCSHFLFKFPSFISIQGFGTSLSTQPHPRNP